MNSAQTAKSVLIDLNSTLLDSFNSQSDIRAIVSERCQHVDALLQKEWVSHGLEQFAIALVAVGGYGRGELHPQSDVDLLFLTDGALTLQAEQALGGFITFLWDAGLEVGHSVRSIDETMRPRTASDIMLTGVT